MILVVDESRDKLTLGPARHFSRLHVKQVVRDLLDSPSSSALARVASILKGLASALNHLKVEECTSCSTDSGNRSLASWMPDLACCDALMLASYAGQGSQYARHCDNDVVPIASGTAPWSPPQIKEGPSWEGPPGFRVGDRVITAIMYFNDWREGDGGVLRLYPGGDAPHVDVEPRIGTLVIFDSRRIEHEVMPVYSQRWALSAWLPALDSFLPENPDN